MSISSPIIIIGAARSGTKFLRSVLAASSCTRAVPYDVSYIWRYGNQDREDDELQVGELTPRILNFIRDQLPRLAGIKAEENLRMIEKTVGNSLRVGFVNAVYPGARFIHLTRDGRAVTESAMRMWHAPPDHGMLFQKLKSLPFRNYDYALWFFLNYLQGVFSGRAGGKVWGPRYRGIDVDADKLSLERVCARQWAKSVLAAHRDLASLERDRVLTLRYEDLVTDPGVLERVMDFLDLPDREAIREFYSATLTSGNNEKWRHNLSLEQQKSIESEVSEAMCILGYLGDCAV